MPDESTIVTIGIPCFNADRWIIAAVESALQQDWPGREVIVVDDGSTDRTKKLLRGYEGQIQLIEQKHAGANRARNVILEKAKGDWIQYLDADDYLAKEKLSHQLAVLQANPGTDLLLSPVLVEEWKEGSPLPHEPTSYSPEHDDFQLWLSWQMPQTGGALWKKAALESLGGWNEKMPCCQEHELYLRAITRGLNGHFDPRPLAIYRIWSETTVCRKNPAELIRTKTGLIRQLKAWMEARQLWEEKHQKIAGQACFEMARKLATLNLKEAITYFNQREDEGLIHPSGDAAPTRYQSLVRILGFGNTERLASALRTLHQS